MEIIEKPSPNAAPPREEVRLYENKPDAPADVVAPTDPGASADPGAAPATATEVAPAAAATPAAEVKPDPKVDFTSKFAALSKRERAIVEQEKKTKAELAVKEKEIAEKAQKYADVEAMLAAGEQKDIAAFLKRAGLSYEQITQWFINGGKQEIDAAKVIDEKAKSVEQKIAEFEKKQADAAAAAARAQEEAVMAQARKGIADRVTGDARFEILTRTKQAEKVYDTMAEVAFQDPSRVATREAQEALFLEVASKLEEIAFQEALDLVQAEKVKAKIAPAAPKPAAPAVAPAAATQTKPASAADADDPSLPWEVRKQRLIMQTLSNDATTAAPARMPTKAKTREDLIRELASQMPEEAFKR